MMATSSNGQEDLSVPLIIDTFTFDMRQEQKLKDMEKRMQDEVRKKKKEWLKEVEKMKVEFLSLYPGDKTWGSDELIEDPLVIKRRGSTDVLDPKKMKTMFLEYPDSGRRFKLRYNVEPYERKTVQVSCDGDRICVTAIKIEEDEDGKTVEKEYVRKIEKPNDVDGAKLKSFLTQDGILIVEAALPPHSLNLCSKKPSNSPTHSIRSSRSRSSNTSSRSRSPSNSAHTPLALQKFGVPFFVGEEGERTLQMMCEIGTAFKPTDITVLCLKDNCIQVKGRNEMRTSDRLAKNKYFKEYGLPEKIETLSLRGAVSQAGRLFVSALCKGHPLLNKKEFHEAAPVVLEFLKQMKTLPTNSLDCAVFPPVHTNVARLSATFESLDK